MSEQAPFWSDDFDMDLPRIVPDWLDLLGPAADVELWTYSNTTHGRINCPTAWNQYDGSLASYFGLDPNNVKPDNYYAGLDKPVPCTFAEAVRDLWSHHHRAMLGEHRIIDAFEWHDFAQIMYHVRGQDVLSEGLHDRLVEKARAWVRDCGDRMAAALEARDEAEVDIRGAGG